MAWHLPKVRMESNPVRNEDGRPAVDLCWGLITSEHGEVELMPPFLLPNRKAIFRIAKHMCKVKKKGGAMIRPDSIIKSCFHRTRVHSDRWPTPPTKA